MELYCLGQVSLVKETLNLSGVIPGQIKVKYNSAGANVMEVLSDEGFERSLERRGRERLTTRRDVGHIHAQLVGHEAHDGEHHEAREDAGGAVQAAQGQGVPADRSNQAQTKVKSAHIFVGISSGGRAVGW